MSLSLPLLARWFGRRTKTEPSLINQTVVEPKAAGELAERARNLRLPANIVEVGRLKTLLDESAHAVSVTVRDSGLMVKGQVEGGITIEGDGLLWIDANAKVSGTVRARFMIVDGAVDGELCADRITLGPNARVTGSIRYAISCTQIEGAQVRGMLEMVGANSVVALGAPEAESEELESLTESGETQSVPTAHAVSQAEAELQRVMSLCRVTE